MSQCTTWAVVIHHGDYVLWPLTQTIQEEGHEVTDVFSIDGGKSVFLLFGGGQSEALPLTTTGSTGLVMHLLTQCYYMEHTYIHMCVPHTALYAHFHANMHIYMYIHSHIHIYTHICIVYYHTNQYNSINDTTIHIHNIGTPIPAAGAVCDFREWAFQEDMFLFINNVHSSPVDSNYDLILRQWGAGEPVYSHMCYKHIIS